MIRFHFNQRTRMGTTNPVAADVSSRTNRRRETLCRLPSAAARLLGHSAIGWAMIALALVLSARSLAESPKVARMVFLSAKTGTKPAMEEEIRRQMNWRREQHDEWRWLTWEYVSGEAGRFAIATFGHAWEDFDQAKVSPWVEAAGPGDLAASSATPPRIEYYDHAEEVSAPGSAQETPALAELAVFQLHFGKTEQFHAAVRQFHEALQKAKSPERYEWFELLNGGDSPQFLLFLPLLNWATFDTDRGRLMEALEKSAGESKAKEIMAQFNAAVKSYQRFAVRVRPELSKLPKPDQPSEPK